MLKDWGQTNNNISHWTSWVDRVGLWNTLLGVLLRIAYTHHTGELLCWKALQKKIGLKQQVWGPQLNLLKYVHRPLGHGFNSNSYFRNNKVGKQLPSRALLSIWPIWPHCDGQRTFLSMLSSAVRATTVRGIENAWINWSRWPALLPVSMQRTWWWQNWSLL